MSRRRLTRRRDLARCLALLGALAASMASVQPVLAAPTAAPAPDVLVGRWVRPDGGYTVTIRAVDAGGRLDASYANPQPLPFARAETQVDGGILRVFLELRAGGYAGSTYTLKYDPARDTLDGEYFQAVARQTYPVRFHRMPAQ